MLKSLAGLSFADTLVVITVALFVLCLVAGFFYLLIVHCGTRQPTTSAQSSLNHGAYPLHGVDSASSNTQETRVHPFFIMKHKAEK